MSEVKMSKIRLFYDEKGKKKKGSTLWVFTITFNNISIIGGGQWVPASLLIPSWLQVLLHAMDQSFAQD